MALVTKTLSQISNGGAYIEVDYQDTNELVEAARWQNNLQQEVLCIIRETSSGQEVINTRLAPGQGGSAAFSGGGRFKLEFYTINLGT